MAYQDRKFRPREPRSKPDHTRHKIKYQGTARAYVVIDLVNCVIADKCQLYLIPKNERDDFTLSVLEEMERLRGERFSTEETLAIRDAMFR